MQFMDLGDTAPNSRFNFRYIAVDSDAVSLSVINILLVISVILFSASVLFLALVLIKKNKLK